MIRRIVGHRPNGSCASRRVRGVPRTALLAVTPAPVVALEDSAGQDGTVGVQEVAVPVNYRYPLSRPEVG